MRYLDVYLATIILFLAAEIFANSYHGNRLDGATNEVNTFGLSTLDRHYVVRTADGTCVGKFQSSFTAEADAETVHLGGEIGLRLGQNHTALKIDSTITFNLAHQMIGALFDLSNDQGNLFLGLLGANPIQATARVVQAGQVVVQHRFELPGPVQGQLRDKYLILSHPLLSGELAKNAGTASLLNILSEDLDRPQIEEAANGFDCNMGTAGLRIDRLQQRMQGISSLFPTF